MQPTNFQYNFEGVVFPHNLRHHAMAVSKCDLKFPA